MINDINLTYFRLEGLIYIHSYRYDLIVPHLLGQTFLCAHLGRFARSGTVLPSTLLIHVLATSR